MKSTAKKAAKVLIISVCLSAFAAAGTAFADTGDSAASQPALTQQSASQDVLQKQQEIDRYVFEEHADAIKSKGITVTSTSPQGKYVEIAITPYSEENAAYLYGLFGKDKVRVVEGQQAVLFTAAPGIDTAKASPDESGNGGQPASLAAQAAVPNSAGQSTSTIALLAVAAAAIIAAAAGIAYKLKHARKPS